MPEYPPAITPLVHPPILEVEQAFRVLLKSGRLDLGVPAVLPPDPDWRVHIDDAPEELRPPDVILERLGPATRRHGGVFEPVWALPYRLHLTQPHRLPEADVLRYVANFHQLLIGAFERPGIALDPDDRSTWLRLSDLLTGPGLLVMDPDDNGSDDVRVDVIRDDGDGCRRDVWEFTLLARALST